MAKFNKEQVRRYLAQQNGPDRLAQMGPEHFSICYGLFLEGYAPAAVYLCRLCRNKEMRERIEELLGPGHGPLRAAFSSPSPKMRKSAARLCGILGDREDAPTVAEALRKEQTRFVRPSLILTLGALGGAEAESCLRAHRVEPMRSPEDKPHFEQEERALYTALKSFLRLEKHAFTGLKEERTVLLRCPDKLSDGLARELIELGYELERAGMDYVQLRTGDLAGLYRARCFTEALIVIDHSTISHPKSIGIRARAFLEEFLPSCHQGPGQYGYRLELKGSNLDRPHLTGEMIKAMDGELLINAPGNYEAEVRVEFRLNGSAGLYLKLYTIEDTRFSYRRGTLPASMHPATAAAMLRYADAYLRPGARVLDPCCGSGTLLIERHKLCPCESLTGVDLTPKATDLAKENMAAAGLEANIITKDCLRFDTVIPYDEVVSNLPFGNRVGTHDANRKLYEGLLDKLPRWVRRGGTAVLYTMEYTLLKKLVRERHGLRLIGEARTQAGGLMPAVFIIKVG